MTITEDASAPIAVHVTTTSGTTAPFTPPSQSLLVVMVAADGGNVATTATVTDSGSHSWSLLRRQNSTATGTLGGTAEVWCTYLSSAPGSITVTASGWSTVGGNIVTKVLLGAAQTQNGATGGSGGAAIAPTATLTPTQIGSRIYGAALDFTTNAVLTANGNSSSIDQFNDATNVDTWAAFKGSADTTTLTSTTYGFTNANAAYNVAIAEILPAAVVGATPEPVVVSQPFRPTVTPATIIRSTLADPPVLTTQPPLVVTQPYKPLTPPPALLSRSSLADVVVVAAATPAPVVVSQPVKPAQTGPAVVLRNTLADPPVLTTPQPLVVSRPAQVPPTPTVFPSRSSLADVVVAAAATPQPLVITSPARPSPTAAIIARSTLFDATTPAPLVVSQPVRMTLPTTPLLLRSSLVDAVVGPSVATPAALVVSSPFRPARVTWATVLRAPQPVDHLCVTPRPSTGTTVRGSTGITAYNTATTARPGSGITSRPNSGTTIDPC